MIDQILTAVRTVWHGLEIDKPLPDRVYYIMQSRRRVIFFLFDAYETAQPLVVVKMNRDPAQNRSLEQSVQQLQQMRILLDTAIRDTVPPMMFLPPINGLVGVVEKALPGQPFETALVTRNRTSMVEEGCSAFAAWLVCFQACTQHKNFTVTHASVESLVLSPLRRLTSVEHKHKALLNNIAEALINLRVPLVWSIGDVHPSNILLNNKRVSGIVDWEGGSPDRWPTFDWFQFLLSLAQELIKAQHPGMTKLQRATMASKLLIERPTTPLAAVFHRQTTRFFSFTHFDPELVLPLFLVFLVNDYWFEPKESLVSEVLASLQESALFSGRGS
jgi:hypothetical protein